jgi:uncharacterized alkaline shock family protein YloU
MSNKEKPVHSPISREDADALSLGRIEIGDEVITAIAARAAAKVEGVVVAGSSFRLTELLGGKDSSRKGVAVRTDETTGHVEIDVDVNMVYGTVVYDAAYRLQVLIKEEVESLTGALNVDKINVRVKNIIMPEVEETEEPVRPDQAYPGQE